MTGSLPERAEALEQAVIVADGLHRTTRAMVKHSTIAWRSDDTKLVQLMINSDNATALNTRKRLVQLGACC